MTRGDWSSRTSRTQCDASLDCGGERAAEFEYYEALRAECPVDIEALTSVEGVGPKTANEDVDVTVLQGIEAEVTDGG